MLDLFPTSWTPYLPYVLSGVTIVLLMVYVVLRRYRGKVLRGVLGCLLAAAALLAGNEYLRGNHHDGLWLNSYEFFHYYLGAKYHAELGYDQLYNATLAAEAAHGATRMPTHARDLASGRIVPITQLLRDRFLHTAEFTPERWEAFQEDVLFLRTRVPYPQWQQQLRDKGYNATPFWTMLGGLLANRVPITEGAARQGLVLIDVALLLLAFAGVAWAFGPRTALLLLLFLGAHYFMSHNTLRAAFIRLDWLACLVLAPCFLKKGYPVLAGGLLAWATLSRIFPGIFVFGIVVRLLWEILRYRQTHRAAQDCLLGFALTGVLLFGFSVLHAGSIGPWIAFFEKVLAHDSDLSPWRVGFKYVFLGTWHADGLWGASPEAFFAQYRWLWWLIQGGVLALCSVFIRRMELYEALLFGFIPFYFFFAPTYYYYVLLMLPMLYFATRLDQPMWSLGLVYVFVTGIIGHLLYGWWDRGYPLFFVMSCLMGGLALYMILITALEQRYVQCMRREIEEELDWLDSNVPEGKL